MAALPTGAAPPLKFGIYPGGAAGTVGPAGRLKPEDPATRLAALQQRRGAGGTPFVLRLYASYTAPGDGVAAQLGSEISQYTAAGFEVRGAAGRRVT